MITNIILTISIIALAILIIAAIGCGEHGITIIISIFLCLANIVNVWKYWNKPTAIDVYRGKTTLEITSVNGIPTDTIVVFKNK